MTIDTLISNGWSVQTAFEASTKICDLNIDFLAVTASHPDFPEVVGSSIAVSDKAQTARFELVERVTILINLKNRQLDHFNIVDPRDAEKTSSLAYSEVFPLENSDSYAPAKSNGVALHQTFVEACDTACIELVERHAVLHAWLGFSRPLRTPLHAASLLHQLSEQYEIESYKMSDFKVNSFDRSVTTMMNVLKPKSLQHPLIYGFGAGFSLEEACLKAEHETIQRLTFLYDETVPSELPEETATPIWHGDYFLLPKNHRLLYKWLDGDYYAAPSQDQKPLSIQFVDLTVKESAPFFVVKAISNDTLPLVFGRYFEGPFAALKGTEREIHPIV